MKELVPQEKIERRIFVIRGQKVMLGMHLAELYGVETRTLIQAVKRNTERFPEDFMFKLTREEIMRISQIVISLKYSKRAYVFTEQGVAMLSSVLRSKRAIQVNIAIMRAFVRLKQVLATHKELARKLKEIEKKVDRHDKYVIVMFEIIKELTKPLPLPPPPKPKGPIGFVRHNDQ